MCSLMLSQVTVKKESTCSLVGGENLRKKREHLKITTDKVISQTLSRSNDTNNNNKVVERERVKPVKCYFTHCSGGGVGGRRYMV